VKRFILALILVLPLFALAQTPKVVSRSPVYQVSGNPNLIAGFQTQGGLYATPLVKDTVTGNWWEFNKDAPLGFRWKFFSPGTIQGVIDNQRGDDDFMDIRYYDNTHTVQNGFYGVASLGRIDLSAAVFARLSAGDSVAIDANRKVNINSPKVAINDVVQPQGTPSDEGLPAGTYVHVVNESGELDGSNGYLPITDIGGNGIFNAGNEGDTVRVTEVNIKEQLKVKGTNPLGSQLLFQDFPEFGIFGNYVEIFGADDVSVSSDGEVDIFGNTKVLINNVEQPLNIPSAELLPAGTYVQVVNESGELAGTGGYIPVADIVAQARPYKVYTALLTQTGTGAPVATVLENTLGGTPIWSRIGEGDYNLTLSGVFTENKVFFTESQATAFIGEGPRFVFLQRVSNDIIKLNCHNGGDPEELSVNSGGYEPYFIEIRVYP
jgi:hypothetical protein